MSLEPEVQRHVAHPLSGGHPPGSRTARDEFLARMSHELRTPLNAVIGFTRVLESNKAGNQRPEDLQLLGRVRANGEKLLRLIEDVLDQSRIELGELAVDIADTDVVEITSRLVEHYRPQAAPKGLCIEALLPSSAQPVRLDPRRFQQVVGHLLDNAVKFTRAGSITVRLETDRRMGRPVRLSIADTGIGIPAEKLPRIFTPFEQVDGTSARNFDGAGLGLSLAMELCIAMGCRLDVRSEVGKGSEFTITLPDATVA